jgi:hypothetical protein
MRRAHMMATAKQEMWSMIDVGHPSVSERMYRATKEVEAVTVRNMKRKSDDRVSKRCAAAFSGSAVN